MICNANNSWLNLYLLNILSSSHLYQLLNVTSNFNVSVNFIQNINMITQIHGIHRETWSTIWSTSTDHKFWGLRLHTWVPTFQMESCPLYIWGDADFHHVYICQLMIAQRYSFAKKLTVSLSIFNNSSSSNFKNLHICRQWPIIWFFKLQKSHWLEEVTWLRWRDFFGRVRKGVVGEGRSG
jgi:hypothetical protein